MPIYSFFPEIDGHLALIYVDNPTPVRVFCHADAGAGEISLSCGQPTHRSKSLPTAFPTMNVPEDCKQNVDDVIRKCHQASSSSRKGHRATRAFSIASADVDVIGADNLPLTQTSRSSG